MATISLLLGRTRDRRRRALRRLGYSGTDVWGRPNFLFVTDTMRKKLTVQEEFVQYRQSASFLPEVATLAELLDRLVARYGGGRPVWSPGALELRVARALANGAPPWLTDVGPPARIAPALAAAFSTWDLAGRPPLPGTRGARLTTWFRPLARELDGEARRTRGHALEELIHELESPSAPLLNWLRRTGLVVIDDVLNPAPLERAALVALARAWATAGTHVVISLETGTLRSESGEDAYFGILGAEERVPRTLRATHRLRRALFDGLIAEFGAEVVVASEAFADSAPLGALFAQPPAPERPDPSDVWGTAEPVTADSLQLSSWPDPDTEVRAIAHAVRDALAAGVPASEVWVAFPGLPAYAGLVRRIFAEVGLPAQVSRGHALVSRPSARALHAAVLASLRIDEAQGVLDALQDAADVPRDEVQALGRRVREGGVGVGPPEAWLKDAPVATARVAQMAALAAAPDAGAWREALAQLAGVERLPPAEQGWVEAALELANALVADVEAAGAHLEGPALSQLWLERAARSLVGDRARVEGAVAVVGMRELRGIHPKRVFIGGLTATDFPGGGAEDWLFDPACRDALEVTEPMAEARYLLGSALRNALATPGHELWLSWPRMAEQRLANPSAVVEELLAVTVDGKPLAARVVAGSSVGPRFGRAEWARAYAAGGWAPPAALDPTSLAGPAELVAARDTKAPFGAWDGEVGSALEPGAHSITSFERFLACPARFFYAELLAVREENEWTPDLSRPAYGALLHRVLQRFLRTAQLEGIASLQSTAGDAQGRLRTLLAAAARAELASDRDVARLAPAQRSWLEEEWVSGLDGVGPKGTLASWLEAEAAQPPSTVHAIELELELELGPLRLRGRADRIDHVGSDGLLVLDHKTGSVPAGKVRAGLLIQAVLYAAAVEDAARPLRVGAFAAIRGPGEVQRGGWSGAEPLAKEPFGVKPASLLRTDGPEGAALQDWLVRSAERLKEGHFHPSVASPELAGCAYCPYSSICRVDPLRAAAQRGPHVQSPFERPPVAE